MRKTTPNVFISRAREAERREFEQMALDQLRRENLPIIDPDRLFRVPTVKPSPVGRVPGAGRLASMEASARQRKTAAYVEKRQQQRESR